MVPSLQNSSCLIPWSRHLYAAEGHLEPRFWFSFTVLSNGNHNRVKESNRNEKWGQSEFNSEFNNSLLLLTETLTQADILHSEALGLSSWSKGLQGLILMRATYEWCRTLGKEQSLLGENSQESRKVFLLSLWLMSYSLFTYAVFH